MEPQQTESFSEADLLSAGATLCYIYTLHASNDPECKPRYVGFTISPKKREQTHVSGRERGRKATWSRDLRARGAKVVLTVVHAFRSDDLVERGIVEASWINFYRKKFPDLLNDSGGGQGVAKCSEWMRAKLKITAERIWKNPKARENASKAAKQRFADPEARAKHSEMRKRCSAKPEFRAKMRELNAQRRANPAYSEKLSRSVKLAWENPEYRKRVEEKKGRYADPEYRKKLSEAKKRACATPEFKAKMREVAKRRHENPVSRAKHKAAVKLAQSTPEARAKRRELAKKQWERPEHRAKFLATRARMTWERRLNAY